MDYLIGEFPIRAEYVKNLDIYQLMYANGFNAKLYTVLVVDLKMKDSQLANIIRKYNVVFSFGSYIFKKREDAERFVKFVNSSRLLNKIGSWK